MKFIKDSLIKWSAFLKNIFEERLNNVDAVIATGSDNTSRYFEYYSGTFRTSFERIELMRNNFRGESSEEFSVLGKDIFSYFGLGCRTYRKSTFRRTLISYRCLKVWFLSADYQSHKYANNYDYQNQFYDQSNSFLRYRIFATHQNENMVLPSQRFITNVQDQDDLNTNQIEWRENSMHCFSTRLVQAQRSFGEAQFPWLMICRWYDTLAFCSDIIILTLA